MLSAVLQNSTDVLPSICAWKCFLGESTEIVKYNRCEGEYDVKNEFLAMHVVNFLVT